MAFATAAHAARSGPLTAAARDRARLRELERAGHVVRSCARSGGEKESEEGKHLQATYGRRAAQEVARKWPGPLRAVYCEYVFMPGCYPPWAAPEWEAQPWRAFLAQLLASGSVTRETELWMEDSEAARSCLGLRSGALTSQLAMGRLTTVSAEREAAAHYPLWQATERRSVRRFMDNIASSTHPFLRVRFAQVSSLVRSHRLADVPCAGLLVCRKQPNQRSGTRSITRGQRGLT